MAVEEKKKKKKKRCSRKNFVTSSSSSLRWRTKHIQIKAEQEWADHFSDIFHFRGFHLYDPSIYSVKQMKAWKAEAYEREKIEKKTSELCTFCAYNTQPFLLCLSREHFRKTQMRLRWSRTTRDLFSPFSLHICPTAGEECFSAPQTPCFCLARLLHWAASCLVKVTLLELCCANTRENKTATPSSSCTRLTAAY